MMLQDGFSQKFLNICVNSSEICEYENHKKLICVQIKDVLKLSHKYGFVFRWPVIAFIAGIIIIAVGIKFGIFPIVETIIHHKNIGFRFMKGYGLISLLIIYGAWLVFTSFKKNHLLLIDTKKGKIKMVIRGDFDEKKFKTFLEAIPLPLRRNGNDLSSQ